MGLPRQAMGIHRSTSWIVLTITTLLIVPSDVAGMDGSENTTKTAASGTTKTAASGNTTTAAPGRTTTAASGTTKTAASGNTTTAAPGTTKTAASGTTKTAASGNTTTAAPGTTKTAASGNTTTAASGTTKTAASGTTTTAAAGTTKTAASGNTTTAAAGTTRTAASGNTTTAVAGTTTTTSVSTTTTTPTTTTPPPPPPVTAKNIPEVQEAVERLEAAAEALSPEGLQGISAEELKQLRTLYDRLLLEYQQQLAVNAELRTSFENAEDLVMVEVTTLKPHQFRIQNDFGMDLTSYFDTGNWESNKLRQYAAALTASYEKGNDKEISFKDEIAEVMNPVRSDVLRVRVDKPFLTDYADKASDAFASAQQTFCETMMSLTRETGNAMTSCSLDKITQGSTVYFASTLTMITSGTTDPLKEVLSSLTTYDGASVLSTEVTLADYLSIQTQAIQDYYGAMSRLVQASNNERVVAAAEEYDFRVPLSTLNLTSPMVDEAKKVYAALQTVYQIVMGRTKFSLLSGCFVTPTEYINELRDNGIGTYYRRLYLEEEVAKLGVNDLSPYVDEPDSQRNLLQRFHKALANSYFLEYHSNSNYSFLPDICAITKPIKFQYLMFKVDKPFDVALKDNTTSVFQDYQNDICGQLISKTMATKKGILLSCGIKHASEGSTVLGVDTTTLVTVPGTDPVESAFSRVGNVMGGKVYGKKITVYNDEVLMSTQEKADIAAREAAEAKAKAGIPQQEEPTSEPTANRFYSVTIPSVIGMVITIALLLIALACCVTQKGGKK